MKRQTLIIILCLTLYCITALLWINARRQPPERYPDWTPAQKVILMKVMDRRTTVIRTGLNEAHFIKAGKRWRIGI